MQVKNNNFYSKFNHHKMLMVDLGTPLWLLFSQDQFSRSLEVRPLLEPWAAKEGVFTTFQNGELAVAIDIAIGEDKDQVVRSVVDRLKGIADVLYVLSPKPVGLDNA